LAEVGTAPDGPGARKSDTGAERFEIGGYWGNSWGRKVLSLLTGVRTLHVHFEPVTLTIDELRKLFVEYLDNDRRSADPYLPQDESLEVVFEKVRSASSFAGVFQALTLPPADEALDLL